MRHQWPAVLCSVLALTIVTVGAQTPAKPGARTYKAPRTAWGDPDISGNYTNKYEQGTPFERPPELEGRRLEDIDAAELSKILKARQTNSIERAPFNGGDPEGRIGGPAEFRDNNEILKGSSAWFVVDPPDGKIPRWRPRRSSASARRAAAAAVSATGPSTARTTSASTIAASRAGSRVRCSRPSTAIRTRLCKARAGWASATR